MARSQSKYKVSGKELFFKQTEARYPKKYQGIQRRTLKKIMRELLDCSEVRKYTEKQEKFLSYGEFARHYWTTGTAFL